MRRNPRSFLWDVCDAADAIASFIESRSSEDYLADRMLRSAVERQCGIIGEALSQLAKIDPTVATRIPDLRRIVGFRNVPIHGYDRIEAAGIWRVIQNDLPPLRAQAAALFAELEDPA
jgi:uncharacterized protein with HEPN domain